MLSVDANTTEVIIAFGGMIAGFYSISRLMLKQSSKDRESDRDERDKFVLAITKMSAGMEKIALSNGKIAAATAKGAKEAKQRNGHLAELVIQSTETAQKIAQQETSTIIDAVQNVKVQHVDSQDIHHIHMKPEDKGVI